MVMANPFLFSYPIPISHSPEWPFHFGSELITVLDALTFEISWPGQFQRAFWATLSDNGGGHGQKKLTSHAPLGPPLLINCVFQFTVLKKKMEKEWSGPEEVHWGKLR